MFERLNTPQEHFHFKFGAALTMEQNVLEMLGKLRGGGAAPAAEGAVPPPC